MEAQCRYKGHCVQSSNSHGGGVCVAPPKTKFFKADEVAKVLPLPGKDFPKDLRGLFWLDEAGFYGNGFGTKVLSTQLPIQIPAGGSALLAQTFYSAKHPID